MLVHTPRRKERTGKLWTSFYLDDFKQDGRKYANSVSTRDVLVNILGFIHSFSYMFCEKRSRMEMVKISSTYQHFSYLCLTLSQTIPRKCLCGIVPNSNITTSILQGSYRKYMDAHFFVECRFNFFLLL